MNEGALQAAPANIPNIPPELVLAILNSVDNPQRVSTLRNARLVSRSWSDLLLRSLYRDVWITLTEADDHSLDALCTFFATHPDICGYVHRLMLYDETADITEVRRNKNGNPKDEDKGHEDEDEDAEEGAVGEEGDGAVSDEDSYDEDVGLGLYRCSVDPDLLKRMLSHLPRLHCLRLYNIFPGRAATLDHNSVGTKGICVQNLRMILPALLDDCRPVAQLILHTLSIFDWVDSVIVGCPNLDGIYTGITEPMNTRSTSLPLRVQSLSCADAPPRVLDELAEEPIFSVISTLDACADSSPDSLNSLLSLTKSCLQSLQCEIVESFPIDESRSAIDLSVCNALNSLTLRFPLFTHYHDAHPGMVKYVNKILDSLARRPRTASALERLVLQITLRDDEPGDAWPLAREEMRAMEDILLNLVDRQVCSVVHVETDLQEWYVMDSFTARRLGKGTEEVDSRWSRYVAVCEEALRRAWSRLEKQGVLAISTLSALRDPSEQGEP